MAKPKLCLIPATIGDKVYSILPSDGVGDFDFTRASAATRINAQGLIETVASGENRLNYPLIDGVVSGCPSLLLENSATNLVTYSEDLTQWTTNENATITSNNIISPDGTLNADKFEFTADGKIRPNNAQLTFVNDYAFSIFIKKGNSRYVTLSADFFTTETHIGFDLDTVTSQSGGIVEKYPNDWYRLSITNNVTGDADKTGVFYVYLPNSLGSQTSVSGNYAYAWGAQVVEGSYPTSYIPSLTGSQTTRAAETCNNAGDVNTFNDSEGVLMAEISALVNSDTYRLISLSDNSTSNEIFIGLRFDTGKLYYNIDSGGVGQSSFISDITTLNTSSKFCVKYKQNDISFYINGFKVYSDTTPSTMPSGLSVIKMSRGNNTLNFYGNTKQIQYFDTALTDTDLEELTSWQSFNEMAQAQLYSVY